MSSKFPVWYYSTSVFVWLISLILIDDFGVGFTGLVSVLMLWQTIRIFTTPTILSVRFINVVTLLGAVTTASLIGLKNSVNVFVALMLIASLLKQIHATKANQFTQICILNFFYLSVLIFIHTKPVCCFVSALHAGCKPSYYA